MMKDYLVLEGYGISEASYVDDETLQAKRRKEVQEQKIYRFNNGYGASLVRHNYSKGHEKELWEMALVRFNGTDPLDFTIIYRDDFADGDVAGYLNDDEILELLTWIQSLKVPRFVKLKERWSQFCSKVLNLI